jgi:hypothetical protein
VVKCQNVGAPLGRIVALEYLCLLDAMSNGAGKHASGVIALLPTEMFFRFVQESVRLYFG